MARESKEMSAIKEELAIVQAEIARLRIKESVLLDLQRKVTGEAPPQDNKRRAVNIKPLVIDIMGKVGTAGATSKEVDDAVRATHPGVGTATVGSVLSRLKADGALVFDGERYFEKRFAPQRPFDPPLRAVN